MTSDAAAVLVGAGRGERMGGSRPKAFLLLAGRPLLLRSALQFEAAGVRSIVAVVPAELLAEAKETLRTLQSVRAVVAGGERRQDSVLAGLGALGEAFAGVVLVHDAARPLVTPEVIKAVAAAADEHGAALPAIPIADTVKRVEDGWVTATLDRRQLFAAQTPQGVRRELLQRAYDACARDGVEATDEAMAVERLGERVAVVPGSPWNRKMTTPDDLKWAEALVARGLLR